jgi:hypothetical protein
MAYSEKLDARIEAALAGAATTRKKMFGGTCHLIHGNMLCGVYKHFLILRLGRDEADVALQQPHVKVFNITGKPMKGWVMIDEADLTEAELRGWIEKAMIFAESLPSK